MGKSKRYAVRNFKRKDIIYAAIAVCFMAGTICGAIKANLLNADVFKNMSTSISVYLSNLASLNFDKSQIFVECLVKYGKTLLIICFLAFIPPTAFIGLLLIFAKGMSVGFTTALLARQFGADGFFYACLLYLPQNLIVVGVYFLAAFNSLNIAVDYINDFKYGRRPVLKTFDASNPSFNRITENGVYVLMGLACIVLASMIEIFVIPWLAAVFIV